MTPAEFASRDADTSRAFPSLDDGAPTGLRHVSDDEPGIRRRRSGCGFSYRAPDGSAIRDRVTLARIRRLAIPPAYADVWICSDPLGHIQATGRDAKGRKQYQYHPWWREARDGAKFARMAAFGRALPAIRARAEADAQRPGLNHDKVVAVVVQLLERTLIRVGNDEYARANKSFGLTTLRNQHVSIDGTAILFDFKGKSGVKHQTQVRDRRLARVLRACQELPGQRLFQYRDASGALHPVGSQDVNAYLREASGEHFTAKDFRTWAATLAAAEHLSAAPAPMTQAAGRRVVSECVKATARRLGNTPAVCRAAYIHPAVLRAYEADALAEHFPPERQDDHERSLLNFLDAVAPGG
jgi:DNA topoisomerase-1